MAFEENSERVVGVDVREGGNGLAGERRNIEEGRSVRVVAGGGPYEGTESDLIEGCFDGLRPRFEIRVEFHDFDRSLEV